jgi:hypothetical protein
MLVALMKCSQLQHLGLLLHCACSAVLTHAQNLELDPLSRLLRLLLLLLPVHRHVE